MLYSGKTIGSGRQRFFISFFFPPLLQSPTIFLYLKAIFLQTYAVKRKKEFRSTFFTQPNKLLPRHNHSYVILYYLANHARSLVLAH